MPRVLSSAAAAGAPAAGQLAGGLPPKAARAPATGKACSELEGSAADVLEPLPAADPVALPVGEPPAEDDPVGVADPEAVGAPVAELVGVVDAEPVGALVWLVDEEAV